MRSANLGIIGLLAVVAVLAAGDSLTHPPALATSPPSADRFALDMNPSVYPANTATSVGTVNQCAAMPFGGTLDFDVVTAPGGIPAANAMTGYAYTLNYDPMAFRIISQTPMLIGANPGSVVVNSSDPLPDSDGTFNVSVSDTGPIPGSAESGPGVLDRLRIEALIVAPPGAYFVYPSGDSHTDTDGAVHTPDLTTGAYLMVQDFCPSANDAKLLSQVVTLPAKALAGQSVTMTIDKVAHNNGEFSLLGVDLTAAFTLPPGCTVNGQSGTAFVSNYAELQISVSFPHQRTVAVACSQPGDQLITVYGCASLVTDINPANNCDTDVVSFNVIPDSDLDGWSDSEEAGTPLCGDTSNEDNADDSVVNDGCPGGPGQSGSFSEAQFNIGTDPQNPCGFDGWPADLVSTGMSANKVDIMDLSSYVGVPRRYGASPGDTAFSSRWDVQPGRSGMSAWINIADLSRLAFVMPPRPPFNGARAFNGPACN